MSNGKVMIVLLTVGLIKDIRVFKISFNCNIFGLIKKILLYKTSDFPELQTNTNKIEVKLGLSNYARKSDLKNTIHHNLLKNMI